MRISMLLLFCMAGLGLLAAGCETAQAINPFHDNDEGYPYVVEVNLQAVNNSGVQGKAFLVHQPDDVTVVLDLEGLRSDLRHSGHFHMGKCGDDVREIDSIQPFQILDTNNGAQAVETFDDDEFQPGNGFYMLHIHVADGQLVACGNVPQHRHE